MPHRPHLSLATAFALLSLPSSACQAGKDTSDATSSAETATSEGATSSSSSSSAAGTGTSTGDASTTGTSTSTTTDGSTTGLDPCSWYWPENLDYEFCPPVTLENAAVSGDTPLGPLDLRYARFGLQLCSACPTAYNGQLALYAAAPGDSPTPPAGDFLTFRELTSTSAHPSAGSIAGMQPDLFEVNVDLDAVLPPVEATSPPLDEGAPPLVTGTITLSGPGWAVSGTFSAPLCTPLDWSFACE